jgi:kynurenine formamidase
MLAEIIIKNQKFGIDFSKPIDISCLLSHEKQNPLSFGAAAPRFEPLQIDGFVGSVQAGGACNCEVLTIVPHCQGTHTECIGHITPERISIYNTLKNFMFEAVLVSITPEKNDDNDFIITKKNIETALDSHAHLPQALIVRTLPNAANKPYTTHSGGNPPYFTPEAAAFLAQKNIDHLLLDVPSIDKENDGGALAAHRAYWQYPHTPRTQATITELVFVPDVVPDGYYLLNIHIASLDTDASPSKPVLYKMQQIENQSLVFDFIDK